jgi:hypothetical protein
LDVDLNVVKEAEVVYFFHGPPNAARGENVAFVQKDLAPDDLFLRVGVSVHVNAVDVNDRTLEYVEMDVDASPLFI